VPEINRKRNEIVSFSLLLFLIYLCYYFVPQGLARLDLLGTNRERPTLTPSTPISPPVRVVSVVCVCVCVCGRACADNVVFLPTTADGVNQIDSIQSCRRRAVSSDDDDHDEEESENWSDDSCGDVAKEDLKVEKVEKKMEEKEEGKKKKAKSNKNKHAPAPAEQCMDMCFSAEEPQFSASSLGAAAADPFAGFTFQSAAPAAAAPASSSGPALDLFSLPPAAPRKSAPAPAAHMRPLDRFVHHQKANGTCHVVRVVPCCVCRVLMRKCACRVVW
jgi:hypothetical protein